MERFALPPGLADEVLARLGVAPPADRAGVDRLYRAWCAAVPFDPVAKAAAMAEGRRPPGDDPVEVAERWLATGLGSTCWGHVAVLGALLEGRGVRCSVGLDRMLTDDVVDFHSFLVADLDGERVALDPIHPSGAALPLQPGAAGTHPAYATSFVAVDGRLEHRFEQPGSPRGPGRYVVVATDLDAADARAFLAVSVAHSGVGRRFFSRRTPPDRFEVVRPGADGTELVRTTWRAGAESSASFEGIDAGLDAVGAAPPAVELLVRAGLLDPAPPGRWAT